MHRQQVQARLASATLAFAALVAPAALDAQGTMRSLECRGIAGMVVRVDQAPSPRDTADVVMVLEYRRPSKPPGNETRNLEPGTCTWNPLGSTGYPVEPGRVRFDVRREAQPWSATGTRIMDTTVGAARFFPDPITLPRYLSDPNHYWRFYVNDATNLSSSFGSVLDDGLPTYVTIKGPLVLANDVRRDLLCRGGSAGLRFGGGGAVGNNLANVILSYRVSTTVPGPAGYGLSPGSCAWTDRTAMPKEPGTIAFITTRNAQIKQAQSGSIDRSPTAAERYPDVFTIPEYLKDPSHFWSFTVMSRDPDSALTNGVWKRDIRDVVATGRAAAGSTTRSMPAAIGTGSRVFRPGGAGSTTSTSGVFDIRNVVISPLLENLVLGFEAAPNIVPTVTLTRASGGSPVQVPVQGSSVGTMWRYVGSSKTPLARNTQYNYTISAPATANARANSKTGSFKTLGQRVTVAFSEIYLVSDGDADSNGELVFQARSCPRAILAPWDLGKIIRAPLDWGDGRHRIDEKLTSYSDTVPDRFRVVVFGIEYDIDYGQGVKSRPYEYMYCDGNGPEPGANSDWDWNSIMLDFDLTKYPGTKGGEQFYRRSKALRNGASLMFEVRGYIEVTRQ